MEKVYKVVHQEEDGRLVSIFAGRTWRGMGNEYQSLNYRLGEITYAPEGTAGVYVYDTLESAKQQGGSASKTSVVFEATPLGNKMPDRAGRSSSPSYPAILLGKEVWRQKPLPPKEESKPRFIPKLKLDGRLESKGLVFGYVLDGEVQIALHWLEAAGFKGKVKITHELADSSPYFTKDI